MTFKHTILVVDDEPDVVKSVQDLLRFNYRVLGATSARDGMKLLETEDIQVVMTDQRMPEITGIQFLCHCRGESPDAIRLLFTGYADLRTVIDAINQGNVYRYITKPWDPDELQAIIREATDRYDLLLQRKKLLAELEFKNQELEAAIKEVRQASNLKSAFIQVASHELRTPLTILLGLSQLVGMQTDLSPETSDLVRRIQRSSERLKVLVDQIITMLTVGRFDRPLQRQSTDLATLLGQVADDVRPFMELRHQQLVRQWNADLGSMEIEPAKIRDSLNHLLLNAIKFTPDEGKITLNARRVPGGGVEMRVSDTGRGIDAASMPRLFEPFFTGFDVSHHSSGHFEFGRQGIGLGLSVVKAFVEMHGGTVGVQSEPGSGATFTIYLPERT